MKTKKTGSSCASRVIRLTEGLMGRNATNQSELRSQDVKIAYRLMFGRSPSEGEVERKIRKHSSVQELRTVFWNSPEFRKKVELSFGSQHIGNTAQEYEGNVLLVHLHMPKTAGSSLSALLRSNYSNNEIISFGDNDRSAFQRLPEDRRSEIKMVHGHLSYRVAKTFPRKCQYITVLRQPKQRLISFFHYVKRRDDHPLNEVVGLTNMSFGGFLEYMNSKPNLIQEVDNGQIRRLADESFSDIDDRSRSKLYRQALSNILADDITYGLTEYFDDFLSRLAEMGLIKNDQSLRLNAAPIKADFSEELEEMTDLQKKLLDDFTRWDQKLYDICEDAYFSAQPGYEELKVGNAVN